MTLTIPELLSQYGPSINPVTADKLLKVDPGLNISGIDIYMEGCILLADAILNLIAQQAKDRLPSAAARCTGFMEGDILRPSVCGVGVGIKYFPESNTMLINHETDGQCVKREALF